MKNNFIDSLENNDLETLKKIPKSDLHNHSTRGGNVKYIEKLANVTIMKPPERFSDLQDMQSWYDKNIKPLCQGTVGFIKRIEAAFLQAKEDGVSVLCMSFGIGDKIHFNNDLGQYISNIKEIHKATAPEITFMPEISFSRTADIQEEEYNFDEVLSYNYFKAIDLIGNDSLPVTDYKRIYRKAKENGYILKAHVGEFSDAESIKKAVDELELNQVQHGIAAAKSKDVMKWLAKNKIQLNICPTSNIMLGRVESYKSHPIKVLYDYGIPVTINTDDMLIFNQGITDEYLNLFNSGLFTSAELNRIREIGLQSAQDL